MPCNCADRRGHHLLGDFRTSPHETRLISGLLTAIVCWLVFPWFWLSLARFDESKGADEQSGNILLRLIFAGADGLLIPLMFAFSAVIHVYVARIPVSGEFPKGQIGWIVPVYLVAGYGVFLLSAGPSTLLPRMRSVFRLSWAASTVVPTILLARPHPCVSVPMGLREERYLLLCVVAGSAFLAALAVIHRRFDLRSVPLVAGLLALTAFIGPLSADDVSVRNQTERARHSRVRSLGALGEHT